MNRKEILDLLWYNPVEIGHWVGFKDLTELHNKWLKGFLYSREDQTLQAHRGSYKTTTLSLFFAIHAIIKPNETLIYFRKTSADVEEIARQTIKILESGCMHRIAQLLYGKDYKLLKASGSEIQTSLSTSIKGSSQIVGIGIGTSITGKHADIIVTDDIVNVNDRISQAERERTKIAYMELQNIKNRGGRFINTGTPWHKEDAFELMPNPETYDCYSTGLMSEEEIEYIKERMTPSLFSANYELKHVADGDALFFEPEVLDAGIENIVGGIAHVDSAFYGEDYTAFSIISKHDGKYYLFGKCWRKHVEDCYGDIIRMYKDNMCRKLYNETNADKGMVARDMRALGIRVVTYAESMNKHIKIATYLKAIWPDVCIVEGTDDEYLDMIIDYTEDAEHDDAPDSAACLARLFYKPEKMNSNDIARPYLL